MARKIITTILLSFLMFGVAQAQGIKQQQTIQKQQQARKAKEEKDRKEREAQERAKKERGQLKYNDLMTLVKIQDVDSINTYLKSKDWEFSYAGSECYRWAFEKEQYGERARAWYTVWIRKGIKNRIQYQINNAEDQRESIRSEFLLHGFKKETSSKLVSDGFLSVYRNEKYELRFEHEYGSDFIVLENYVEIETMKDKVLMNLLMAEEEEKSQNYQTAIHWYKQALEIANSVDFMSGTEKYCQKINELRRKDEEQRKMNAFLQERKYKVYDYEEIMKKEYVSLDNDFKIECDKIISSSKTNIKGVVYATYTIDTLGNTDIKVFFDSITNNAIKQSFVDMFNEKKIKQPVVNGYPVMAATVFRYNIEYQVGSIYIRKTPSGIEVNNNVLQSYNITTSEILPQKSPYGLFKYDIKVKTINNLNSKNSYLKDFRGMGTGECAFLSLLIPGLGDHKVTYGKKNGVATALLTYGFLGLGTWYKIESIKQYKLYHNATTQSSKDSYYEQASLYNTGFLLWSSVGLSIWTYDIFWVWVKGHKNKVEQNRFKSQHLSAFYMPSYSVPVVNYTLTF